MIIMSYGWVAPGLNSQLKADNQLFDCTRSLSGDHNCFVILQLLPHVFNYLFYIYFILSYDNFQNDKLGFYMYISLVYYWIVFVKGQRYNIRISVEDTETLMSKLQQIDSGKRINS